MNTTGDLEVVKNYIMEGLNFEYTISDLPGNTLKYIESKKKSSRGYQLNPDDRIKLAQNSFEIGQVLAYSVYRRYEIFIDKKKNKFILRMFKR